ncbi:hypothetical protein MUK42_35779 [Musa troglodytarum]|uniref:Uncharacterized protein n=1 Tax=Musa troglodytarum TaxID=320322 RepID=A0A9E7E7V6_9LILI|nr:hypothetical protein MUK42_35779 [Musa troglodytarum]
MIPGSGLLPELPNPSYDFAIAKNAELLFVKSSPSSLKTWNDDYIHKVAAECKSLIGTDSPEMEHKNFAYLAMRGLDENAGARLWRLDDSDIGVKLGYGSLNDSESKLNMVFWDQEMALTSVQRELDRSGLQCILGETNNMNQAMDNRVHIKDPSIGGGRTLSSEVVDNTDMNSSSLPRRFMS